MNCSVNKWIDIAFPKNVFIDFLSYLIDSNFIDDLKTSYFGANCILNSMSALNNLSNQPNQSFNRIYFINITKSIIITQRGLITHMQQTP